LFGNAAFGAVRVEEFGQVEDLASVAAAAAAFVGTHFLLSHPLRKPMVGVMPRSWASIRLSRQ
jgi:hypothetical protein